MARNHGQKKLRGKRRKFRNPEKHVPHGMYCYQYNADGNLYRCPFHYQDKRRHYQEAGGCLLLKANDGGIGLGLLWDLVKSCEINDEEEASERGVE